MSRVDFLIIGAAKSGTTSLTAMLRETSGVFVPPHDELNFWAWDKEQRGLLSWGSSPQRDWPVTDRQEYEKLFTSQPDDVLCGECSVVYMESAFAIERAVAARPTIRVICCLREPVDRAVSGYAMARRQGKTSESIEDAFSLDRDRIRTGEYDVHIGRVLSHIAAEQLLLLSFDDLKAAPDRIRDEVGNFLGLDTTSIPHISQANRGGVPKNQIVHRIASSRRLVRIGSNFRGSALHSAMRALREANLAPLLPVPQELRYELQRHYTPHLSRLEELTGFDVEPWVGAYGESERSE